MYSKQTNKMSKKISAFRIEEKTLEKLKLLAKKNNRSQANMLEILINDAAKKEKVEPR